MIKAKSKLQAILRGEDFYFQFSRIGVYSNGQLLANLTDANIDDATTIFKRRGTVFSKLDIYDEKAWRMIQNNGLFRELGAASDLLLDSNGWQTNSNTDNQFSIVYGVHAGGIDFLVLIAEGDTVRLQITSGNNIILLADPKNYF